VNIGIIGAALSHPLTFGKAIQRYKLASLTGIWGHDEDQQRIDKFTKEMGIPALGSAKEVFDKSDAVMITTMTNQHRAFAEMALEAGRPVFVDKPLATNLADARAIVDKAKATGTPIMSCSMRRYSPAFVSIAEQLKNGDAGKVVSATRFEPHGIMPGDWQDCLETSGGLIFNFGIHCVDTLQRVMGLGAEEVNCYAGRLVHKDADTVDHALFTIKHKDGGVGYVEMIGCMSPNEYMATAPHLSVFATEKSMEAKLLEDQALEYGGRRLGVSPYYDIGAGAVDTMIAFVEMIRTGKPAIGYDDMIESIAILEAARTSANESRPVKISEL
jgi:myo-inositol 2-dehydrogenase/D-chiro-inositol 1-dehydrogenase